MQPKTALKIIPSGPLTKIEELEETWRSMKGQANIVSPVASVDSIPALHGISLRAVMINPTIQGGEVYVDYRFCTAGEVALGGVALQKIAAAAGINITERNRLDDRSHPYYCDFQTTISIRDYDGTLRKVTSSKEINLRDGAPETEKPEKVNNKKTGRMVPLDPSALADKRRNIQSLAETKSFYRALRTLLQLKQKYTQAELAKPFVVPKLVPMLDPSDPDQKKALIAMATGQEVNLYGAIPDGEEAVRQLKDVTPTGTAPILPKATIDPETDGQDQEPPEEPQGEDFEVLDIQEAPAAVCECPCSCQAELTEEVARKGTERIGAPRCRDCFPGRSFSVEMHRDVGNLQIPKHPNLTAQQVIASLKKSK